VKMCCSAEQRDSYPLPAASAGSSPGRLRPSHRTLQTVTREIWSLYDRLDTSGVTLPFFDDIAGTALSLLFQELCAVPLLILLPPRACLTPAPSTAPRWRTSVRPCLRVFCPLPWGGMRALVRRLERPEPDDGDSAGPFGRALEVADAWPTAAWRAQAPAVADSAGGRASASVLARFPEPDRRRPLEQPDHVARVARLRGWALRLVVARLRGSGCYCGALTHASTAWPPSRGGGTDAGDGVAFAVPPVVRGPADILSPLGLTPLHPVWCSHAPGIMPGQPSLGSLPGYEKIGNAPDASTPTHGDARARPAPCPGSPRSAACPSASRPQVLWLPHGQLHRPLRPLLQPAPLRRRLALALHRLHRRPKCSGRRMGSFIALSGLSCNPRRSPPARARTSPPPPAAQVPRLPHGQLHRALRPLLQHAPLRRRLALALHRLHRRHKCFHCCMGSLRCYRWRGCQCHRWRCYRWRCRR